MKTGRLNVQSIIANSFTKTGRMKNGTDIASLAHNDQIQPALSLFVAVGSGKSAEASVLHYDVFN